MDVQKWGENQLVTIKSYQILVCCINVSKAEIDKQVRRQQDGWSFCLLVNSVCIFLQERLCSLESSFSIAESLLYIHGSVINRCFINRQCVYVHSLSQAAISQAFQTPEILKLFIKAEPSHLRDKLAVIQRQDAQK